MAPSWDTGYDSSPDAYLRAPGTKSSQHPSSSGSSYNQQSSSPGLAPQFVESCKLGLGRTSNFHLGGQEIFSTPVADPGAFLEAPQGAALAGDGRRRQILLELIGTVVAMSDISLYYLGDTRTSYTTRFPMFNTPPLATYRYCFAHRNTLALRYLVPLFYHV